ncbi:hypothetical protein JCM8547_004205 [Rhodosporidiobolus lusitaniae]
MATLERGSVELLHRTLSAADEPAISTSFVPSAVPTAFAPPLRLGGAQEEDLIDLGQERLFSGTRTARREGGTQAPLDGNNGVGTSEEGTREGAGSQELLGSLGAARHAFLFALNGLVQQYFSPTATTTDSPVTSGRRSSSLVPSSSTDPFAGPSVSPLRNSSVATDSTVQPADVLLSTILDTLRSSSTSTRPPSAIPSPVMRSIERSSPLLGSPRSATSAHSNQHAALLEELHALVESAAADLPPLEADLARSLSSLIACIDRLSLISRHDTSLFSSPPPQSTSAAAAATDAETPSNVYETLEREASALQARRDLRASEADVVVGAAREVEQAERELLWGRVGDLSERVKLLSRHRAATLAQQEQEEEAELVEQQRALRAGEQGQEYRDEKRDSTASPQSRTSSLYEPSLSDLPRYSHEHDATHSSNSHLPPDYFGEYAPDEKETLDWDVQPPTTPSLLLQSPPSVSTSTLRPTGLTTSSAARTRKISSVHGEKMQRDLDSVTEAIERLYVVSPQLANQRVEPDRRKQRERQLAKLGNAIERLSQGRLEDQRAVPSPILGAEEQEIESTAQRRKREQAALDRLLDQIDRAASRTLADQRVELNGKRKEVLNSDTANPDFEPLSDKYEARRREYILSHTGKGRLAGQDAMLHSSASGLPSLFPPPNPELSEPVTISEFFADEPIRARSHSVPNIAAHVGGGGFSTTAAAKAANGGVKKKFSSRTLFQAKVTSPGSTPVDEEPPALGSKKGSLRIGVFKRTGSGIRRGSYDASGMTGLGVFGTGTGMSRSSSAQEAEVLAVPQFDWITEESRNLGTLVVTFWTRSSSSSKEDEYEVLMVDSDSIVVASVRGGPASRLSLPCRVIPQHAKVVSSGSVHEVKLITSDPSPTKSRADLEVHTPLSTDELRRSMPTTFNCSTCNTELADTTSVSRYNALPSEHWAELLDAWMCHPDQELSADLVAKGKGIKPRENEGLVGTSYILLDRELTKNWTTPEGSEATRSPSNDLLDPAHCSSCSSLIGSHVRPQHSSSADSPSSSTSFRLLKYATYPSRRLCPEELAQGAVDPPQYSLASFLTAEMLETGQAHACHRFVLEEAETEKAKLLLWFFNPAVRLSFSTSSAIADHLGAPSSSTSSSAITDSLSSFSSSSPSSTASVKLFGRSMNAVKVFYAVVSGDDDPRCASFLEVKTERIPYPRAVIQRVADLLRASSLVYPSSKRKWTTLDVGFLERI